jgi:hypothetical protein
MKNYIKIGLVVIFILSCVGLGINFGLDMRYNTELAKIEASRNTALDNYKSNKSLAESYLQVYDIQDESSYQNVKNDMYHKFSTEMQKELFPTVNYEGLDLHDLNTELIRVIGTNNGYEKENTFLLEYRLTGVNYDQTITNLVTIQKGVITDVVRIK